MNVLNDLPSHSRVWIYQASRKLSSNEVAQIKTMADAFVEQWTSHGKQMKAATEVLHHYFIVIAVDEQTAATGGCGIDRSVNFIQQLEKEFSVSLLDRMNVAFRSADNTIHTCPLPEFERKLRDNEVNENTIVFNNLVANKAELLRNWEIPLKNSWHGKLLQEIK